MSTKLAACRGQKEMGSEALGVSSGASSAGTQPGGGLIRVGDCPPGVELEAGQFNTNPDFHPVGGVELGGVQFNSEAAHANSPVELLSPSGRQIAQPAVQNTAPTLAEEVLPELAKVAPLVRRRGPRVLTHETVEEFCRLLSVGLSRRQAAARLDVDHSTVSKAAKEDPELATLLQRAEDLAAGEPLLCLIAASRKSWRAALSLIKHRQNLHEPTPVAERDEKMRERVDDKRRELEYQHQVAILEDQARDREVARKHARKEAAEAAWQERERLMLAKERAERAERKKRRLAREAAQQGDGSSNQ